MLDFADKLIDKLPPEEQEEYRKKLEAKRIALAESKVISDVDLGANLVITLRSLLQGLKSTHADLTDSQEDVHPQYYNQSRLEETVNPLKKYILDKAEQRAKDYIITATESINKEITDLQDAIKKESFKLSEDQAKAIGGVLEQIDALKLTNERFVNLEDANTTQISSIIKQIESLNDAIQLTRNGIPNEIAIKSDTLSIEKKTKGNVTTYTLNERTDLPGRDKKIFLMNSPGGGGGGSNTPAVWGGITGTLSNQADLQSVLDGLGTSIQANGVSIQASGVTIQAIDTLIQGIGTTIISLNNTKVSGANTTDTIGLTITGQTISANLTLDRNYIRAMRQKPSFYTDLHSAATAAGTPWAGSAVSAGTMNTANSGAVDANHPGVVKFRSASTAANSGFRLQIDPSFLLLGGMEYSEIIFNVIGVSQSTIRFGFIDTATINDCIDGCYFELGATTQLLAKTANNSNRTTADTSFNIVEGNWYRATIDLGAGASRANFNLYDDGGSLLWTEGITATIPNSGIRYTGNGIIGTHGLSAAVDIVHIDWLAYATERTLVR